MNATPEQIEEAGEIFFNNTVANERAAQILAEMLGLVCHREFIQLGDQMVRKRLFDHANNKVFVIHIDGLSASFYWAEFPVQYLDTVRNRNLADLKDVPKVTLHHTRPKSLIDPDQRDRFLQEFVAIIRCIADGYGNVGFLRRDLLVNPLHRVSQNSGVSTESDDISIDPAPSS